MVTHWAVGGSEHLHERWAKIRPRRAAAAKQSASGRGARRTPRCWATQRGASPAFNLRIDKWPLFFCRGAANITPYPGSWSCRASCRATRNAVLRSAHAMIRSDRSRLDELVDAIRAAHPEVRFGFRTKYRKNHLTRGEGGRCSHGGSPAARVEADAARCWDRSSTVRDGVTFAQAIGDGSQAGREHLLAERCKPRGRYDVCSSLTEAAGSSRWTGGFRHHSYELRPGLGVDQGPAGDRRRGERGGGAATWPKERCRGPAPPGRRP